MENIKLTSFFESITGCFSSINPLTSRQVNEVNCTDCQIIFCLEHIRSASLVERKNFEENNISSLPENSSEFRCWTELIASIKRYETDSIQCWVVYELFDVVSIPYSKVRSLLHSIELRFLWHLGCKVDLGCLRAVASTVQLFKYRSSISVRDNRIDFTCSKHRHRINRKCSCCKFRQKLKRQNKKNFHLTVGSTRTSYLKFVRSLVQRF